MFTLILLKVMMTLGFMAAHPPPPMNDADRFYKLTADAGAAYTKGDKENARILAERLLAESDKWKDDWNYGNSTHVSNIVLGLTAVDQGDVAEAKSRLLAAGRTTGSPQLKSFGPNMLLADRLLEKGETDVVLEYFDLCRKFWTFGSGKQLDQWTAQVKAGERPDFKGNLRYFF